MRTMRHICKQLLPEGDSCFFSGKCCPLSHHFLIGMQPA